MSGAVKRGISNLVARFLPFQPRRGIRPQNPKIFRGIPESFSFLLNPVVVLRKQQPSFMNLRFGSIKSLRHLRPIRFEQCPLYMSGQL